MRQALIKLKEYLSLNLEMFVAGVESEEGVAIERWRFLEIFENYSNQYPAIEILPAETRIAYGTLKKLIIESLAQFDIDIDISVAGSDPQSIGDTVLGYKSAVKKMIEADETFGKRFL